MMLLKMELVNNIIEQIQFAQTRDTSRENIVGDRVLTEAIRTMGEPSFAEVYQAFRDVPPRQLMVAWGHVRYHPELTQHQVARLRNEAAPYVHDVPTLGEFTSVISNFTRNMAIKMAQENRLMGWLQTLRDQLHNLAPLDAYDTYVTRTTQRYPVLTPQHPQFAERLLDHVQTSNEVPYVQLGQYLFKGIEDEIRPQWKQEGENLYIMFNPTGRLDAADSAFVLGEYSLKFHHLDVYGSQVDVRAHIHDIDFGEPQMTNVTAKFIVRNMWFDLDVMAYIITMNEAFRHLSYLDELQTMFADKKKITLHVRIADIQSIVTINPNKITESTDIFRKDGEAVRMPQGTQYTQVSITGARNMAEVDLMRLLVLDLLSLYERQQEALFQMFRSYIPNLGVREQVQIPRTQKRIKMLRDVFPEMFISGYARECQTRNQPLPIAEDEVESWRQTRQVLRIPAPIKNSTKQFHTNKVIYLTCPSEENPYIGLKENKLPNRDRFPYLPCCYKEKHLDVDPETWEIDLYKVSKRTPGKGKKDVYTPLPPMEEGEIPGVLETLLGTQYKRTGMTQGPNNLIHCFLYLTNARYRAIENKEAMAQQFRRFLRRYPVIVTKQEQWDRTLGEIREALQDETLRPELWVRLFEHLGYRIFVFEIGAEVTMQVPRHKHFYVFDEQVQNVPTLILYQYGSGHCDVIHGGDYTQGQAMQEHLLTLFKQAARTVHLGVATFHQMGTLYDRSFTQDLTYQEPVLRDRIVGQFIDRYGKSRSAVMDVDGTEVCAVFRSWQPMRVDMRPTFQNPWPHVQQYINKHNLTIAEAAYSRGQLVGVYVDNVYLPIIPTNVDLDVTRTTTQWYLPEGEDVVSQTRHARQAAHLLRQIILALWNVSGETKEAFAERLVVREGHAYDIVKAFVGGDRWDTLLPQLEATFPTMVENGQIFLDTEMLRDRALGMLHPQVAGWQWVLYTYDWNSDYREWDPRQVMVTDLEDLKKPLLHVQDYIVESEEPYIYRLGEEMYLIQHVQDGTLERAVTCAYYWHRYNINPGYHVEPRPLTGIQYQVATVTETRSLYGDIGAVTVARYYDRYIAVMWLKNLATNNFGYVK